MSYGGYVYFIHAVDLGMIKIGYSGNHPDDRFRAIQATSPVRLVLAGYIDGDLDLEHRIHHHFREYRAHGEWFYECAEIWYMIPQSTYPDEPPGYRAKTVWMSVDQIAEELRISPREAWFLTKRLNIPRLDPFKTGRRMARIPRKAFEDAIVKVARARPEDIQAACAWWQKKYGRKALAPA